jgi:hypothetical protein
VGAVALDGKQAAALGVDRFAQLGLTVLLAVDGYRFAGKAYSRLATVARLQRQLPTLRPTILVPQPGGPARPDGPVLVSSGCGCCPHRARPACRRASCTVAVSSSGTVTIEDEY